MNDRGGGLKQGEDELWSEGRLLLGKTCRGKE